jgi:hypothetical protein
MEVVYAEVDLARRLDGKLERSPPQPRRVRAPRERGHERLGPEVLVEVDGGHG